MHNKIFNDKKGQVGETTTWVVATVLIITILAISIFAASVYFGGSKKSVSQIGGDTIPVLSFMSYLLTEDGSDNNVYDQIKDTNNLTDFNGELALEIFREFYDVRNIFEEGHEEKNEHPGKYLDVWVGVVPYNDFFPYVSNNYFGTSSFFVREDLSFEAGQVLISDRVLLNEKNDTIGLYLTLR